MDPRREALVPDHGRIVRVDQSGDLGDGQLVVRRAGEAGGRLQVEQAGAGREGVGDGGRRRQEAVLAAWPAGRWSAASARLPPGGRRDRRRPGSARPPSALADDLDRQEAGLLDAGRDQDGRRGSARCGLGEHRLEPRDQRGDPANLDVMRLAAEQRVGGAFGDGGRQRGGGLVQAEIAMDRRHLHPSSSRHEYGGATVYWTAA